MCSYEMSSSMVNCTGFMLHQILVYILHLVDNTVYFVFSFCYVNSDLSYDISSGIFSIIYESLLGRQVVPLLLITGCSRRCDPLGIICSGRNDFLFDCLTDLVDKLNYFSTRCCWSCGIGKFLSDKPLTCPNKLINLNLGVIQLTGESMGLRLFGCCFC